MNALMSVVVRNRLGDAGNVANMKAAVAISLLGVCADSQLACLGD